MLQDAVEFAKKGLELHDGEWYSTPSPSTGIAPIARALELGAINCPGGKELEWAAAHSLVWQRAWKAQEKDELTRCGLQFEHPMDNGHVWVLGIEHA